MQIHSPNKAVPIASSSSGLKKPLFKPIICGEYHRTPNASLVLYRSMLKEIYHLAKKGGAGNTRTNIIAVMGLAHLIGLENNYPNAAIYRDVSEVSDFKNCLNGAFKPREEDFKLPEPTQELNELFHLIKSQKPSEDNHARHP